MLSPVILLTSLTVFMPPSPFAAGPGRQAPAPARTLSSYIMTPRRDVWLQKTSNFARHAANMPLI